MKGGKWQITIANASFRETVVSQRQLSLQTSSRSKLATLISLYYFLASISARASRFQLHTDACMSIHCAY